MTARRAGFVLGSFGFVLGSFLPSFADSKRLLRFVLRFLKKFLKRRGPGAPGEPRAPLRRKRLGTAIREVRTNERPRPFNHPYG